MSTRTRRAGFAGLVIGTALLAAACGGTRAASVAGDHPSAAAAGSSAAAAASAYASSPAVKAAESTTETAVLKCEQTTHADPLTSHGRTAIGDCMAPAAVRVTFRTCRNDALSGVHFGASHPVMTYVDAVTGCYVVVVLKQPLPQGLSLPAGFTAPATSPSTSSSPSPATSS